MKKIIGGLLLLLTLTASAQKRQYVSAAFTDNASAYPFGKFAGFFNEPVHAGFEFGWGHVKEKNKHDWYWELKAGYFYHQFVQNGIPIYVTGGYRYRIVKHFSADVSLGLGYFHSIATTAVLKQNSSGEYVNAKGIGRPQVMVPFTLGANYDFNWNNTRQCRIFIEYQQRIQAPFVNSYVPILPYNQLAIGFAFYLPGKK
ncbi:hypothetical protein [Flavihumibacter profundi]|jgi:hypothetical protein|uniref:hypothetical protein n=1 Tax=Flavihumibacter profundi TaxID=2716883 RepID=UPI001CC7172F|nr:hypothetical protein [Flavihumibacter profundi]MBZ5857087.1 hypothetical protein [Flavihumibacter profundi]